MCSLLGTTTAEVPAAKPCPVRGVFEGEAALIVQFSCEEKMAAKSLLAMCGFSVVAVLICRSQKEPRMNVDQEPTV